MIWQVETDVHSLGDFRRVVSSGAHWATHAIYDPDYISKGLGKFDPTRMVLTFDADPEELDLPIADFPRVGGFPPTCSDACFRTLFWELLQDHLSVLPIQISGARYCGAAPTEVLYLFDPEASEPRTLRDDGTPVTYRTVKLIGPPKGNQPIFRIGPPYKMQTRVFVDDRFRDLYLENALTGLEFVEAL